MAANLAGTISSILSVALLTSGGSPAKSWQIGQTGYPIAEVQAQLGVLGFDSGPVTGRVSRQLLKAADRYVTSFGIRPKQPLEMQLSGTLTAMGTVPQSAHGPLILAVESDLMQLGLYHGALHNVWSQSLTQAVKSFDSKVGVASTVGLTSVNLTALAHWTSVAVAARHHWFYVAQPGDSLDLLAWAARLPVSGFSEANHVHGGTLAVGQPIRWIVNLPVPRTPHSTPLHSSAPASSSPPSPSHSASPTTAVLANIKPVSDLVLMNPDAEQVQSLLTAQAVAGQPLDVAVAGDWALIHPGLIKSLAKAGDEIAITGYTTANLNTLPAWGVSQELRWSVGVMKSELGAVPTFLVTPVAADSTVVEAANRVHATPMSAAVLVPSMASAPAQTTAVIKALLAHANEIVAVSGNLDFTKLFQKLSSEGFVFETLGQIWAGE